MKYTVNFRLGYAITRKLKVRKLRQDKKGVYIRTFLGKDYVDEDNCRVIY